MKRLLRILGFGVGGLIGFGVVTLLMTGGGSGVTKNGGVIIIDRPAEVVFSLLSDCAGRLKWIQTEVACERITAGPIRAGSQFREVSEDHGRRVEMTTQVLDVEPEHELSLRFTGGRFSMDVKYTVSEQMGKTFIAEAREAHFAFPLSLIAPIIQRQAQEKLRNGLLKLKSVAESR